MEQTLASERSLEDPVAIFEAPDLDTYSSGETHDEHWGDELYMLVNLNQGVIVRCPWTEDAEVSLGTAMTTYEYPPNLTAEDEPFLISVVNELLDNRVIQDEEPEDSLLEVEEELAPKEDEIAQAEDSSEHLVDSEAPKGEIDPVITKKQNLTQNTTEVYQRKSPSAEARKSPQADKSNNKTSSPKASNDTLSQKAKPTKTKTKALKTVSASEEREVKVVKAPKVLETIATEVPEVIAEEETVVNSEIPVVGLERTQAASDDDLSGPPNKLPTVEISVDSGLAEQDLEIETLTALAEEAALSTKEMVEGSDKNLAPVISGEYLDSELNEDSFEVENTELGYIESPDLELADPASTKEEYFATDKDDEDRLWTQGAEVNSLEENNSIVEQILAEYIEQNDSQSKAVTSYYLSKIIEVAAEVHAPDVEGDTGETTPSEELEKLFTELFDEMGVAYTPELIEDLVAQTAEKYAIKNKNLKDEEKEDDDQQSSSIAILKKPSVSHAALNDAIVSKRLISKVAFELCGFRVSFSLN